MTLTDRTDATQLRRAVTMLKVVAHPVRLAIVDLLTQEEKLSVGEIQQVLNLQQAVASQHLSLMCDKGVLLAERVGRQKYLSLRFPKLKNIVSCLESCCTSL